MNRLAHRLLLPMAALLTLDAPAQGAASTNTTPKMRIRSLYNPHAKRLKSGPLVSIDRPARFQRGMVTDKLVSARQYRDLSGAAIAIMEKYAPHEHLIIGMGRDPAPLIAYLQNVDPRLAINFPANGDGKGVRYEQIKPFIRKLLPQKAFGGRKLVLLDETSSGKTPHGYAEFFARYLRELGLENEIIKVALNRDRPSMMTRGLQHLDTSPWPDVDRYRDPAGPYENTVSEYPKMSFWKQTVRDLVPRPEYDRFRAAVRRRMVRDRKLEAYLTRYKKASYGKVATDSRLAKWGFPRTFNPMVEHEVSGAQLTLTRQIEVELLTPADYRAYSWGVQRLFEKFPAEKGTLFVGVGVTSSPLMALLQSLDVNRVGYLPIDDAKLDGQEEAVVAQLKRSLAKSKLEATQRIVLYQRGNGRPLAVLKDQMAQALAQAGYPITVDAVAFNGAKTAPGVERIDIRGNKPLLALDGRDVELLAPFKRHLVGRDAPTGGVAHVNYRKLVSAIGPFVASDAELDQMLRAPAPPQSTSE